MESNFGNKFERETGISTQKAESRKKKKKIKMKNNSRKS